MIASRVIGDTWKIPITLTRKSVPEPVNQATEIKAVVYDEYGNNVTPVKTLSSSAIGADWLNGLVIMELTSLETSGITAGTVYIEIQVETNSNQETWKDIELEAKKGQIQ